MHLLANMLRNKICIHAFRLEEIIDEAGVGRGGGLSPPQPPLHLLRRGSEGSTPWGTSASVESGSEDDDSAEGEGGVRARKGGSPGTPGTPGTGTAGEGGGEGSSDQGAGGRRGSKLTDYLEKKKRHGGEKERRKADKQGTMRVCMLFRQMAR